MFATKQIIFNKKSRVSVPIFLELSCPISVMSVLHRVRVRVRYVYFNCLGAV